MRREDWPVRLETYLDGELEPAAAAAFERECAADPELTRLLQERLRLRDAARAALGDVPAGLTIATPSRWRPLRWVALAAAAALAVVVLRARLAETDGAGLPRPPGATGLVVAPRLDERPGEVMVLVPGRLVLPDGYLNMGGE